MILLPRSGILLPFAGFDFAHETTVTKLIPQTPNRHLRALQKL